MKKVSKNLQDNLIYIKQPPIKRPVTEVPK